MKISITAASALLKDAIIIEVNSIDEAIKKLQTDKELVKSIINVKTTWLEENSIPTDFILKTYSYEEGCDYSIEIYDGYRE